MLDTTRTIETPEGIELVLHLSGPVVRMLAWVIDTLIRIGIYIVLAILLSWMGDVGVGLLLILLFLVEWFYPVVFEVRHQGMTPGKRAMGIRVVHDDGTPIGWPASLVRNLLRFVDSLPLFYVVGFVSMTLNSEFRRLGDIVAGTVVVYPGEHQVDAESALSPSIKQQVPLQALREDEAQAVVEFAERITQFSPGRADELAGATGPLIPDGAPPAKTLQAYARWMVGQ